MVSCWHTCKLPYGCVHQDKNRLDRVGRYGHLSLICNKKISLFLSPINNLLLLGSFLCAALRIPRLTLFSQCYNSIKLKENWIGCFWTLQNNEATPPPQKNKSKWTQLFKKDASRISKSTTNIEK